MANNDKTRKPEDYLNEPEDAFVEAGIPPKSTEDFLTRADNNRVFPKREHLPKFAQVLKDLRKNANIKRQVDVEKETDGALTRNMVSLYEQGKVRDIPSEALRQLAKVYSVTYEYLVRILVQEKYGIDISLNPTVMQSTLVPDLTKQIATILSNISHTNIDPNNVLALLATYGIEHLRNGALSMENASNTFLQNTEFSVEK